MVSVEGVESSQSCPASTECFGSVTAKPADVGAGHGDLEECDKVEHSLDGVAVQRPGGEVVSKPFPDVAA